MPLADAPLKLTIAAHFVHAGRVGGAEQMLYNLVNGLSALNVAATLLCGSRQNLHEGFLTDLNGSTINVLECGGSGVRFIAEQRACMRRGLSSDAILFPNYYVPPFVPSRLGRIGVVMHDFQFRHFPQYFSSKKRAWLRLAQQAAVLDADRIIAISSFVRDDAIRWFGQRIADKVRVVPNALCWERLSSAPVQERPCAAPYILSVAAQYPHKNLVTLVKAFGIVAKANRDIELVLCGQSYDGLHGVGGTPGGLGTLAEELGLTDRIRLTGFVNDAALARWYQHAEMFAFPSLFEGFGMPPVEALGLGLPTLTTRTTAIPEATMGLSSMVDDPLNVSEWADKIMMILREPSRYRPDSGDTSKLRAFYHPTRIASEYITALTE
jgi:glycosyltransferase involved in cell wall biosynthesis